MVLFGFKWDYFGLMVVFLICFPQTWNFDLQKLRHGSRDFASPIWFHLGVQGCLSPLKVQINSNQSSKKKTNTVERSPTLSPPTTKKTHTVNEFLQHPRPGPEDTEWPLTDSGSGWEWMAFPIKGKVFGRPERRKGKVGNWSCFWKLLCWWFLFPKFGDWRWIPII